MLGILKESCQRVALTPAACKKIKDQLGVTVQVESGAGVSAGYPDHSYSDIANVSTRAQVIATSKVLVSVDPLPSRT